MRPICAALVVGDGHRVDLRAVAQLEPVLEAAQEPVGVGELAGVVLVDVAGRAQLGQGGERRRRPQVGIEPAVDELEQLHGELDVADAAATPLHLAVGEPAAGQLRLAPRLEVAQRPEVVGAERPATTAGGLPTSSNAAPSSASPATERALSSAWNSHGSAHRSQYASNEASERTSGPTRPSGRRLASTRKHVRTNSIRRRARLLQLGRVAVADEHHVDVAGVVQLVAAELAHPDDGERWPVGGDEPVGRAEHVGGEGRDGGDGHLERIEAEQVTGGDPELLEALPPAQLVGGCRRRLAGRSSRAASTASASGSVSSRRASGRLAPLTATNAAASAGSSASSLAASGWAATSRSSERRLAAGVGRSLDRLVEGGHAQSVPDRPRLRDPQSNRQRVTFWGNPLSVQAYTVSGRSDQNGRNDGSCSWV